MGAGAMMNWNQVEGSWHQIKGKVREQWGRLTDDDVDTLGGKREKLAGKIQERYGISLEEADREIREWMDLLEVSRS